MTPFLPDDIARCPGVAEIEDGVTHWREGCERCARRLSPPNSVRVAHMEPPEIIVFECPGLIEIEQDERKGDT